MVLSGERDNMATAAAKAVTAAKEEVTAEKAETTVAVTTRRERWLHNFTLPSLKWGNRQPYSFVKTDGGGGGGGGGSGDHQLRRRSPPSRFSNSSLSIPFGLSDANHRSINSQRHRKATLKSVEDGDGGDSGGVEEGIQEVRMKIMSDLKTVREKITQSMFKKDSVSGYGSGSGSGQENEKEEGEISPTDPWLLRYKRAAYLPISQNNVILENEEKIAYNPSAKKVAETIETKERRKKLSMRLSRKEIREDYMVMFGRKPPRWPKKRSKALKKKLNSLTPGFYLSEVTVEKYEV